MIYSETSNFGNIQQKFLKVAKLDIHCTHPSDPILLQKVREQFAKIKTGDSKISVTRQFCSMFPYNHAHMAYKESIE